MRLDAEWDFTAGGEPDQELWVDAMEFGPLG